MSKQVTLRRPRAGATLDELSAYRREIAAALIQLGVGHGDHFVVAPAGSADGPKARTADPGTAKLAALRNAPRRGSQRAKIVEYLVIRANNGGAAFRGSTASDIAGHLEIPLNSISTRMSELERGGWVAVRGTTEQDGAERSLYVPSEKALRD